MISDLRQRLAVLEEPDRTLDALIALDFLGAPYPTPGRWGVKDNMRQPMCFQLERDMDARLRREKERDGEEVLCFEHQDRWLLFVTRTVPHLTGNLTDVSNLVKRLLPGYIWLASSEGDARITDGDDPRNVFEATAILPTAALILAMFDAYDFSKRLPTKAIYDRGLALP